MMNRNLQVFIDRSLLLFFLPFLILFKIKNFFLRGVIKNDSKKTLFIKFIGMGNFYNLDKYLNQNNLDILTLKQNYKYFEISKNKNQKYLINTGNIFLFFLDLFKISFQLIFKKYDKIIIFENDSTLSKLLGILPLSNKISGISNVFKSIINQFYFDQHFVNFPYIGKQREIELIDNFDVKQNIFFLDKLEKKQNEFIENFKFNLQKVRKISIYSECGDNEITRKLNYKFLNEIINLLVEKKKELNLIFSNQKNPEYLELIKNEFNKKSNINILITSTYDEYVNSIKESDLIITADSQTAHLSNYLEKIHIVVYGPSLPYEVNYDNKRLYPMSNILECCPCTNRYYTLPCEGKLYCFNFNYDTEKVFKYL